MSFRLLVLCFGTRCPMKYRCYRYIAIPDRDWQPIEQFEFKENFCSAYLEIEEHIE